MAMASSRSAVAGASLPAGLSGDEVARRQAEDGPNLLPGSAPKTFRAIVMGVLTEPMFLMLLVAGGIYLLLGDRAEALFLLAFVFVVISITLVQERKTQRALEALRDLSAPRALVVRDGREQRVPGRDIVRGDVLVLHEGDRVPADALLVQGQLSVDESLLTGEAVPVTKLADAAATGLAAPGGDGTAALFASTVVTRGLGLAVVRAIGAATAVGRIGQSLATTEESESGLQRDSRRLIRVLTGTALALAGILVLVDWRVDGRPLLESLLAGIALAMAILPEEIPVILTVFLALGAWRIARLNVLTRRVPAVEALGAITVLAVDKTGTLTQNRMQMAELAVDGNHFRPEHAADLPEEFHLLVEFAMLATPADPFDPMEKAIQEFGHRWLAGTEHVHDDRQPEQQYDLSPGILAMTRVFSGAQPSRHLLATKGAPEAVADLCHLATAVRVALQHQVEAMAACGLRVLGVACGEWRGDAWPQGQHDFDFRFLGLVGFLDPPRVDVPAAIAECRAAGIRVLMLTGDHPATARAIARQVGLSERPDVITGMEVDTLTDDVLRQRLKQADLCARLRPEQKLRLLRLLQQDGEVVAMTGDGVNDAPALKAADTGIAMGGRGTDVARESAALVLLDDSFASIVAAIRQGRRIYDNITTATRFVFAVHVPVIALALVPALLNRPALLLPVHIVLLELLIDPACSVVFEAEPAADDVMARPPRARDASPFAWRNVGRGLLQGIGIACVLLAGYELLRRHGCQEAALHAGVFMALVATLFLLVLFNRDTSLFTRHAQGDGNPWLLRMLVLIVAMLAALLTIPWLQGVMGFTDVRQSSIGVALALLLANAVWLALLRWRQGAIHGGGG